MKFLIDLSEKTIEKLEKRAKLNNRSRKAEAETIITESVK